MPIFKCVTIRLSTTFFLFLIPTDGRSGVQSSGRVHGHFVSPAIVHVYDLVS